MAGPVQSRIMSAQLRFGVLGAVAFCAGQIPLLLAARALPGAPSAPGWFLNSGTSVFIVGAILAAVAAIVSLRKHASLEDVVLFAAGAVLAMIATLFAIGPGTIFPIVIVFGVCVIGMAVAVGGTCGAGLRALRHAG